MIRRRTLARRDNHVHSAFERLSRRLFAINGGEHLYLLHVVVPFRHIRNVGQHREDFLGRLLERNRTRVRGTRGRNVTDCENARDQNSDNDENAKNPFHMVSG